ncbi:ankyrin repeat domain-containing protein [Streptomyces sp. NPDC007063]|uniref:ankyrin repeat domain-containing protein n=1 Tax=Streptomyces sp. NPDC007063 TaxID=3364772 RepID=UPI0036BE399E
MDRTMEYKGRLGEKTSPAYDAIARGRVEDLTRLLDIGVDPNGVSSNMTLLLHAIDIEADGAVQTGKPLNSACTAVLPAYGADPELSGPDGTVPRLFAFHCGHGPAVRLIESHMRHRRGGSLTDPCPTLPPAEPETAAGT